MDRRCYRLAKTRRGVSARGNTGGACDMQGRDDEELAAEIERLRRRVGELEKDRIHRDAAMGRTEEYMRLLTSYMPVAVALFDRDMRYLLTSRRWFEDYGLSQQDLTGLSHYEVFPEIPQRWKESHQRCLAGSSERHDEDPFQRTDGRIDWVRWQVFPWHDERGEIGGIMMFTEVITKQKELHERLRAQSAALRELSTPIIPICDEVLVLPLIGALDERRSQQLTEALLGKIADRGAQVCIVDLTGVPAIDARAASALARIAQAVRLLGAEVVLTGIRPEVAQALVTLEVELSNIITRRDLSHGIAFAMATTRA
ncbi:STAS domain-containing protein [Sorangium sp. So ce1000]|uniref:STAS domain-containing protein n=1 Tax=Sorangium sp. So ce1000 TaxID=3133325 RepID=UPI003F610E07